MSTLDAALAAARLGPVFPVHEVTPDGCTCGNAACPSPGKHPRMARWQQRATKDRAQIERWWRETPTANVGIATGRGLCVIDLDGEPAHRAAAELGLPATFTVRTGRADGGEHRYYQVPEGLELPNASGGTLAPGIDVRADGGFVVAAGSRHQSGQRYQSINGTDLTPLPAPVLERLTNRRAAGAVELTPEALAGFKAAAEVLTPGQRAELERETAARLE